MDKVGWVYILSSGNGNVLYVGVTNNLSTRVWEHRTKRNPKSFTARYNVFNLVYYERLESIVEAIEREKYIKGKTRAWKDMLIDSINPSRIDLYESIDSLS
jgi:putative endonuclease